MGLIDDYTTYTDEEISEEVKATVNAKPYNPIELE